MVARVLFPVLTWRGNAITPPAPGDHQGPPFPTSSTLAPTDTFPARTQTLSAAHHLIALEFALVEYHQCAVQDAFTIVAAGINANGVPDLARCMRLVNVPMQSQQRLVTLDCCTHCRRADGFEARLAH